MLNASPSLFSTNLVTPNRSQIATDIDGLQFASAPGALTAFNLYGVNTQWPVMQ
jgi:hypothetical protein